MLVDSLYLIYYNWKICQINLERWIAMKIEEVVISGRTFVSCRLLQCGDYDNSSSCEFSNVGYMKENYVHECLSHSSLMRDADDIELEDSCDVILATGYYGFEKIYVSKENSDLFELVSSLEDYPVIDDSYLSELEMKWIDEAWERYGLNDVIKALSTAEGCEIAESMEDESPSTFRSIIYEMCRNIMEEKSLSEYTEGRDACLPTCDIEKYMPNHFENNIYSEIVNYDDPVLFKIWLEREYAAEKVSQASLSYLMLEMISKNKPNIVTYLLESGVSTQPQLDGDDVSLRADALDDVNMKSIVQQHILSADSRIVRRKKAESLSCPSSGL